jgi:TRAP-type C4-dicarboxylate transport system substrate-binding protein
VKVNFIQGEQLGNDVQVIEQTMRGSVHVYGDVLEWYSNWVKDFSVLAWGFTFRDGNHMAKFLESPEYVAMAEELRLTHRAICSLLVTPSVRLFESKMQISTPRNLESPKRSQPVPKAPMESCSTRREIFT